MQRRHFLRNSLAVGLVGVGTTTLPVGATPATRRARRNDPIRLSSNENPLGLSPDARRAVVDGLDAANRYPGGSRRPVIEALAQKHDVHPRQVLLGNGSTEVLQIMVQLIGGPVVLADPTFEDVPRYARAVGVPTVQVPLRPDYSHDVDGMRKAVADAGQHAMVYLCNPNNPTGTLTDCAEIDAWISEAPDTVFFLVDEAYYEYAEGAPTYWSAQRWIEERRNVMAVRTFSKIFGMAGMRLGYGLAHADTVGRVGSIAGHNNANHLANVAALASLRDREIIPRSLDVNTRARAVVHRTLDSLELPYLPSFTNFLMHRINGDLNAYRTRMAEHGIAVGRPFPPMLDHNRLSFGTVEEMERWSEVITMFRSHGWV